jgi:hypothetical protein
METYESRPKSGKLMGLVDNRVLGTLEQARSVDCNSLEAADTKEPETDEQVETANALAVRLCDSVVYKSSCFVSLGRRI